MMTWLLQMLEKLRKNIFKSYFVFLIYYSNVMFNKFAAINTLKQLEECPRFHEV